MIDSRELRIGNWVELRGENRKIDEKLLYNSQPYYSNPIPLTPEILENCGFEKDDFEPKWFSTEIGFIENRDGGFILPDSDGENSLSYVIQYLHQLQNLYFALTQTEITINLK